MSIPEATIRARREIAGRTLVRRKITRAEIASLTGLSLASVTLHTRWLLENRFLKAHTMRVDSSKRPIEELRIDPDRGTGVAIQISADTIRAEVIAADDTILHHISQSVSSHTQRHLLEAISILAERSWDWVARNRRKENVVAGLSVPGTVAIHEGIIFTLDDVDQWEPCQPYEILPAFKPFTAVHTWTQVLCKCYGLAAELRTDDRLCYVEFDGQRFRVAALKRGEEGLGRHGTSSHELHRKVADDGPLCYCGRRGCLAALLKQGESDERILGTAFCDYIASLNVDHIGWEWAKSPEWLVPALRKQGLTVHVTQDAYARTGEGLRLVIANSIHQHAVQGLLSET